MNISSITNILTTLKSNNLVTIPIRSNGFEECQPSRYSNIEKFDFNQLDDIIGTFRDLRKNKCIVHHDTRILTKVESLLYALACVKHPVMSLHNDIDKQLQMAIGFKDELINFLTNTKVKDLNFTKPKLTKKHVSSILTTCLGTDIDSTEATTIVSILSCRYLQSNITIMQGTTAVFEHSIPNTNKMVVMDLKTSGYILSEIREHA
jgi:hypothetical protein